jgi:dehydrogenase/reductase SDR family protein 12
MNPAKLIDTALDRTIVLGYGNVGLAVRRRLPGWPPDPPRMDGRVVLVTGAPSGLGLAACAAFARLGAEVHAVARSRQRAGDAVSQISEHLAGADVHPHACDLSSLAQLRSFAERFAAEHPRLDVLVNNAGVMPSERRLSADGHELMFATHVLAPFALTALLTPSLARSAPARVINVSSGGAYGQALPAEDFQSEGDEYGPKKVYARTKREQIAISELWDERLRGSGVRVYAMHPGWADTAGVRRSMPRFRSLTGPIMRTPEQGADTIVWLGAAPEPPQGAGGLWHDRRRRPTHYLLGPSAESEQDRARLWAYCASLLAEAGIEVPR